MNSRRLYFTILFASLAALAAAFILSLLNNTTGLPLALLTIALACSLGCVHLKLREIGITIRRQSAALRTSISQQAGTVPTTLDVESLKAAITTADLVDLEDLERAVHASTTRALASYDSIALGEIVGLRQRVAESIKLQSSAVVADRTEPDSQNA